jgi:hypothetical protein
MMKKAKVVALDKQQQTNPLSLSLFVLQDITWSEGEGDGKRTCITSLSN